VGQATYFGGDYQPDKTKGYVYWAAFTTQMTFVLRAAIGAAVASLRRKRALVAHLNGTSAIGRIHRTGLSSPSIDDGEPPSQHLWNNNDGDGVDIKVMPLAPQVYGNYD
ncbi:hypothetical protein THAOC_37581, partial [Thalassiosira oceanica]